MKKLRNPLINLSIIFSLLFCMAFACNNDSEDRDGTTPPARTSRRANGSPTEDDVKAWVTEYENMLHPTGVSLSEPDSIDFTFGEISFGQPRVADTGDKIRKVESDYLYPVVVEYTIHQYFKDGDHPSEKKYNYELYRNAQGGWSAFSNGPAN
ncbi:MAG: hypothetical protein ACR2HG_10350 [Pyrinomonadaceae bacterium]